MYVECFIWVRKGVYVCVFAVGYTNNNKNNKDDGAHVLQIKRHIVIQCVETMVLCLFFLIHNAGWVVFLPFLYKDRVYRCYISLLSYQLELSFTRANWGTCFFS